MVGAVEATRQNEQKYSITLRAQAIQIYLMCV